jgi:hypothetical protein
MGASLNIQSVLKQIFTGNDNETVAWGRVMGSAVFGVFVIVTPQVVLVMLALRKIDPPVAFEFMDRLTTFVPAMCLAAAALVAGTYFSEPKGKARDTAAPAELEGR